MSQYNNEPRLWQEGTKVLLRLPNEKRARTIGKISGGVYRKNLKRNRHTHNKSQSVGFNYQLIRDGEFRYVCVQIGSREYWTLREFILAHGHFQHYKSKGYEKQIFLNYSQFGIETARKWYDEKKALEEKQKLIAQKQMGLFDGVTAS